MSDEHKNETNATTADASNPTNSDIESQIHTDDEHHAKHNEDELDTIPVDDFTINSTPSSPENDSGDSHEQLGTEIDKPSFYSSCWKCWCKFYETNSFTVLVVASLLLALAYPPLGAIYLQPDITASWIALIFIFLLAGLGLKTKEFKNALKRVGFNIFVQVYSFGADSAVAFGVSRLLLKVGAIPPSLADGMVICACLPVTVNMVFVLTKSSGGDEAAAVFHSAFGNIIGVFLTPALILGYVGQSSAIDIGSVFLKLTLRVLVPVLVGQLLQKCVPPVVKFVEKHKRHFKTAQEWGECLLNNVSLCLLQPCGLLTIHLFPCIICFYQFFL